MLDAGQHVRIPDVARSLSGDQTRCEWSEINPGRVAPGDHLPGRNFARAIEQWHSAGYHVSLIFLSLPSGDLAVQRVAQRMRQDGHAVPEENVRRRFDRGREHFETLYKPLVDAWMLYDGGVRCGVGASG
ncbi:MAG: hypothetical protein E6J90_13270 [Deltaproteobacteria bacterium]|nr:MAG: hypothetical protein E6J91_21960 [Deltaproteobacteria bacterium]TMQ21936.1 MAG: hypothetical protein E6J90_13270 [Deltaproteobacteria bacterium]